MLVACQYKFTAHNAFFLIVPSLQKTVTKGLSCSGHSLLLLMIV